MKRIIIIAVLVLVCVSNAYAKEINSVGFTTCTCSIYTLVDFDTFSVRATLAEDEMVSVHSKYTIIGMYKVSVTFPDGRYRCQC